ncbi:hypothetical protein MRBLMC3_000775 [Sphingobium sp. LMC3-1-1.1]|uniref:hypothetical protein n=1 Tax=Sphingobium sp. LMC3-1-1.1 TaxID=3135241 RepID=UPI00341C7D14
MNLMKWCLIGCSTGWVAATLPWIVNGRANAGTALVGVVLIIWWITYALMLDAPTDASREGDKA